MTDAEKLSLIVPVAVLMVCHIPLPASASASGIPAFRIGIEAPSNLELEPYYLASLRNMGINYINYYVVTSPNRAKDDQDLRQAPVGRSMMALADKLGADYSIACHAFDPSDDAVKEAVARGKSDGRFKGIVFDEPEHCRLLWNYSRTPLADAFKWTTLDQAYGGLLDAYRKLRSKFTALGCENVTATHAWPVMLHIAAREGYTVCPKICKEFYSPVSLAIGMGAAKEYGRQLWVDVDLWYYGLLPGHTPEEMRSNLLLAYWLGADLVYVEGAGHNLSAAGKQGPPFSLVNRISPDKYQLTPHGEVLRWFCRDYVPSHPRAWTFRDVRPYIAIVRFEDTCHGQRYESTFPDNLYGSPNLHSDQDTEAWFQIWNLLTFNKTGRDGLSLFKVPTEAAGQSWRRDQSEQQSYTGLPELADTHTFWTPLHGAIVYDHLVGYDLLKGIPLIFLTGKEVSDRTMAAIDRCVQEGAVCVAWGPLAKKHGFPDWESGVKTVPRGKGKFVITGDFQYKEVYNEIAPLLGTPDEIRYRFGDQEVTLNRVDENKVTVDVRKPADTP